MFKYKSLLKRGQLQMIAQSCVQLGFIFKYGDSTTFLGNVSVLDHLHSKEVFSYIKTEFTEFEFVPIGSVSLGTSERRLALLSLFLSLSI